VTLEDAVKHPNWSMGQKITIDSATLMNKALEVIEAHYLFGIGYDDIDIVIHPQSIIHSMVEFQDTSVLAQLGWPDMRLPLLYALSWPHRLRADFKQLSLPKLGTLSFSEPDFDKYPALRLGYAAGRAGGTMPAVFNAANEKAVELFRAGKLHYLDIVKCVEYVMNRYELEGPRNLGITLEDVINADAWAREVATEYRTTVPQTVNI